MSVLRPAYCEYLVIAFIVAKLAWLHAILLFMFMYFDSESRFVGKDSVDYM